MGMDGNDWMNGNGREWLDEWKWTGMIGCRDFLISYSDPTSTQSNGVVTTSKWNSWSKGKILLLDIFRVGEILFIFQSKLTFQRQEYVQVTFQLNVEALWELCQIRLSKERKNRSGSDLLEKQPFLSIFTNKIVEEDEIYFLTLL